LALSGLLSFPRFSLQGMDDELACGEELQCVGDGSADGAGCRASRSMDAELTSGGEPEGGGEGPVDGGAHRALVPVRPGSDHREMWRVTHDRVVAVRAEPSHHAALLGTRRPGVRIIASCREGDWLLLHADEGYGLQPAWMLADGAEIGLGMLMMPDARKALRQVLEASPAAGPTSAEVVVNVRLVGSGFNVDVKVPREAKVFEVKHALAEFIGRPEVLEAKLLRRKSDDVGFAARTDNPGYTSLRDGDDLGAWRQLFVVKVNLQPAAGSPAEDAAKATLPKWVFRTEYRPLSLLDEPRAEEAPDDDEPESARGPARGASAAAIPCPPPRPAAGPSADPPARVPTATPMGMPTGPRLRVRAPPHLRVIRGGYGP